jgi:hypothetical protein
MKAQLKYFAILLFFLNSKICAADDVKSTLVFDPQTKKYFIGGQSKFILKPGEDSSVVDRIEISIDGAEYQPYGQSVEFKQEGKHTLKFRAINPVNNWSPVQFLEVFVDLTPATTQAKFSEERSYKDETGLYVGLNSTVTLQAQDDLSGVGAIEYSWDGSNFVPYTKPLVVDKSGKQAIFYRSVDRVGNIEPAKKLEFIADGLPPASEMKLVGSAKATVINGVNYVSDSIAFTVTAVDSESKVKQMWVEIDGKKQGYIKPVYFLKEGQHTFTYYSVDNVDNKEAPKTFSFYTVSTPPKTNIQTIGKSVNMGGVNFAQSGFQVKLNVQENVVGTEKIEVRVDKDGAFQQYIEPLTFRTPGIHNLVYRAVDRTGNVEPEKNFTVKIVDSFPSTKLNTAQPLSTRDGVMYSPAPNVVTLNVSDETGVGIDQTLVSINDAPFAPYRGPITLDNNTKIYKISYKSVDRLGNEEQEKVATFHMMRAVPVVDLFISGSGQEEKVRTNYLDTPGGGSQQPVLNKPSETRKPAANPKK